MEKLKFQLNIRLIYACLSWGIAWYAFSLLCPAIASQNLPIIVVQNAEEFIDAIGSNRIIHLEPGTYLRSEEFSTFPPIQNVENLSIVGLGEKPVKILTSSQFKAVLSFYAVRNVLLENIEVGHTQGVGSGCYAGVISFVDSHNISIKDTVLFGSGTEGLTLRRVQGLLFKNSIIKECTNSILTISESSNINFENAQFFNNNLSGNGISIYVGDEGIETSDIIFSNCAFVENINERDVYDSFDGSLFYNVGAENVRVENSLIAENVLGHLIRGELQLNRCRFDDNYFRRGAYATIVYHEGYMMDEEYSNCVRDQQPTDPDFTVVRRPFKKNDTSEIISIVIPHSAPFDIGIARTARQEGELSFGVDVNSIRVHKLPGNLELLHIEWIERPHGWNTEECHYSIRKSDEPKKELLKGKLHLDTDGYTQIAIWGGYRITYESNMLGLWVEREEVDYSRQPKPLYYKATHYRGMNKAVIDTRLTREYQLHNETLYPVKTILEYQLQTEDTMKAVSDGLGVDSSWIQSFKNGIPGEWITISIPNELPEEKYPDIVKKSLGMFEFSRILWGKGFSK